MGQEERQERGGSGEGRHLDYSPGEFLLPLSDKKLLSVISSKEVQ